MPIGQIEDRDENNNQVRYGRRKGRPYYDPKFPNEYHDNEYDSNDQPIGFPHRITFRFRLIVVDICRQGKIIYRSKILTVNF